MEDVLRTAMGIFVLGQDISMSRHVECVSRLDGESVKEILPYAQYVPAGGVVINAGGFIGDHATVYSQLVGATGHVFVCEPHPISFKALELNMARFNNVSCYNVALGMAQGPSILHEALDRGCSCIMPVGSNGVGVQRDGSEAPMPKLSTNVDILDELLLPDLFRCDLIHLDCEGTEVHVLIGAQQLLAKFHPVLVLEVGAIHLERWKLSPEQVFDFLNQQGYCARWISAVGQGDGVYNILALPR